MGAPGCDDAPLARIRVSRYPKPSVQLVMPYYENPRFLARQIATWRDYLPALRRKLYVTVIDDGSPEYPAKDVLARERGFENKIKLFRIDVDVRWNWLAARNVGMHYASDGWCVLTDMDHVIPESTLNTLVFGEHDPKIIYRFSRIEGATGASIHPHPNSWFMTKAMFWRTGGYDEACSGYYGTDGDYRRRCAATAPIRLMPAVLVRHEHQDDSSTRRYLRKQPEDARAKQIMRTRGQGWRPKVLSFPHREVSF